MGSGEGEPAVYHWPIYYHFAWLMLPLLLAVLACRAPNRRAFTPWLLPLSMLLLPAAGFWLLEKVEFVRMFGFLADSLTMFLFAMALLWLVADKIAHVERMASFGYAVLIMFAAGVIGLIGVSGFSFGLLLIPAGIVYGLMLAAAMVAILFTGIACRKRYSPLRFLVWLFIVCVPCMGGVLILLLLLPMSFPQLLYGEGLSLAAVPALLATAVAPGLILGLIAFGLVFPFMALAVWAPAFRPRFHALFRLPEMQSAGAKVYNDLPPEVPPAGEAPMVDDPMEGGN